MAPRRLSIETERHLLPNGLRVVLHHDTSFPLVAVNLWYHVGSKNEAPGRTGLAHLFEHMLFQGSQHVGAGEHHRNVQRAGGSANGSTWYDRTSYYQTLPSKHLELALWLESDRLGFLLPALSEEKFETQRQVVLNERRRRIDNRPYGFAYEALYELLFPAGHPYRWPVIGYAGDVEAATLEEARSFFRTFYIPNNAVLSLAGDFDPEWAVERIEAYFGPIPRGPDPPSIETFPVARDTGNHKEVRDRVRLARVYMGFQLPAYGDRSWYAANLLSSALTSGRASLLYRDLVYQRQIAQDVDSFVLPTELSSVLILVATCKPEVEPGRVEAALEAHLGCMGHRPLEHRQLERCRRRVLTEYFRQLQTLERRADSLAKFTTYFDDPQRFQAEVAVYETLSAQDLIEVAAQHLQPAQGSIVRYIPG